MVNYECEHCGSDDAYELFSGHGPRYVCLQCLAVERLREAVRSPFERFDERRYEAVRGWVTVLARVRRDEDPLPESDRAADEGDPEVPETIVEFLDNVMERNA